MNVQNVFDKVIDSGLYAEKQLMCHAVKQAWADHVINCEEKAVALAEIKSYLKGYGSLAAALDNKKLAWDYSSRLAIYKDWTNKPSLEK